MSWNQIPLYESGHESAQGILGIKNGLEETVTFKLLLLIIISSGRDRYK
jgi:hypothetical protein